MKKTIALILALALCLCLFAGCGKEEPATPTTPATPAEPNAPTTDDPFSDGPTYNLNFSNGWSESLYYTAFARERLLQLSEDTNGKVNIEFDGANALGSDAEVLEAVMMGDVAFIHVPSGSIIPYIPECGLLEMPMLFPDFKTANNICAQFEEEYMQSYYNEIGLTSLYSSCQDFRVLTNNKLIESYEDLAGNIVRNMQNKYTIEFWKACGAAPTYISGAELAVALQQGVADGQENPLYTVPAFAGIQKYVYDTNTTAYVDHLFVNTEIWEGMPAAYQDAIKEAFFDIRDYIIENHDAVNAEYIENIADYEMEYIEISDDMRAKMDAAKDSCYDLLREDIGDELIDAIFAMIDSYGK